MGKGFFKVGIKGNLFSCGKFEYKRGIEIIKIIFKSIYNYNGGVFFPYKKMKKVVVFVL